MTTVIIVYGLLLVKKYLHYDDTLDVAIVHGCGKIDVFIGLLEKAKN
jgi:ammonia channel protein AmtB